MAFDLDGARKAGYSDDEIADFMSKELGFDAPAARDAGYSSKAIVGHLAETLKTRERAQVNAELDVPYRPVSRAVAPKQNAGAGRGMMAEQAGERAAYNAPKKPVATGVMAGYVDPGTPTPGVTESYAPTTPETRAAISNLYNAATPEKRAEIAAGQGFVAQQVTELEQRNALMDARKSPTLERIDPRAEKRASRMVGDGLDPEIANRMAPTQARMGVTPGQEIPGTIGDTKVDFSTRDAFSKTPVLSNPVVRGMAKGGLELVSGFAGVGEAMADLAFGEQKSGRQSSEWIRAKQEAIGEGTGGTARLESVISSLTQQLPYMVGGAWVARGAASAAYRSAITAGADEAAAMAAARAAAGNQGSIASLSGMAVTSFGSEYLNGKNKGLTPGESAARASLLAAFEVIGESFGLGNALRSIERAAGGISGIGALSEFLAANLYRTATREVPGELLTTTGQFLSDKLPGIGLNQQAGWDEYLKQMGETVIQTVMQGGIMAGGTTGVARAVAYLREGGRTPETPDPYAPQSLFSTPPATPPGSPSAARRPEQQTGNATGLQPVAPQVIQSPEAAAAGLAPIVIPGTPDQNGAVGALTSSAPMLAAIDKATTEVGPVQPGDTSTEREQIPAANVQVAPPQAPAGDPPAPTVTALPDSFPSKSAASIFIKQNGLQDTVAEKGDAGWMVRPAMRAETPEEAAKNDARAQSLNTTFERIGSTERVRAVRGDASEKSTVARVLGEVFGLPQVLVRGIKDNALYLDGVSYINAKISKTGQVIQAAVHEAFHWAAATHPDIAQGYLDAITPFRRAGVLAERAKFENENLKPGERQFPLSAGRGEDFSKVNSAEEEVGADVWGAMGLDPVLWQQMRAKDPSLFRAIRYRFLENVTRAINALSKRGVKVDTLITDRERVRELTSDAMAAVARRGDGRRTHLGVLPDGHSESSLDSASSEKPGRTDIGKPISATAIPNSATVAPPSATPAPAPKVKPKKRAKDAFLAFLGDHGVSSASQKSVTGEVGKKGNRMIQFAGPMFRKNGRALDELALLAVEAGFLTQADIDADTDNGGVNKLTEMIRRAHAGEAVKTVSQLEREFEQSMVEFDEYDTADLDLTPSDYEDAMDGATELQQARIEALTGRLVELLGEGRAEQEIDRIVRVTEGMSQEEYADELERTVEATARIQGADAGRGDQGGQGSQETNPGAPQEFSLEGPTQEGLKSKAAQAESRRQEQARRDAAPPADDFTLTGSDRQADRAAAAGQMELGAEEADPRNAKDAGYAPRRSKATDINDGAETAADRARSLDAQRISARNPTGARRTEDPMGQERMQPGLAAMRQVLRKDGSSGFAHNMGLVAQYPGAPNIRRGTNPDRAAEQFIVHAVENLRWLYDNFDPALRERAKLWYVGANRMAHRWAKKYGFTPEQVAGAMAALSPQQHWFRNVSMAERIMDIVTLQADRAWSREMEATARRILTSDKNAALRRAISGKTLRQVWMDGDTKAVAAWVRAFDEAHNDPFANVITPEGNVGETALIESGLKMRVQWGSFLFIENAISILANGSRENISARLGEMHKVRSFYNNIIAPYSTGGDVTIDTHAVAAALLQPLAGSDREVEHNFGGGPVGEPGTTNSIVNGSQGTYGLYADAYRRLADELGILPRELQSITWEAVRGLFEARQKTATLKDDVNAIWRAYHAGRVSDVQARDQVSALVRGITSPSWAGSDNRLAGKAGVATYAGELSRGSRDDRASGAGGRGVVAERDSAEPVGVAPRRAKRGKDQLSFDYELDPSQTGPAGEAAKRRAVDAVDSLRGTAGILALALSRDLAARQRTTLVGQTVAAPVDLAVLAQVYRDPRFETFRIFFVDGQDRVVSQIGLTQRLPGAVNAVMGDDAYEFANNLMVEARKKGATGFYMLHNHPSGQATPSGADESMTVSYAQQLMPTMKFHGHVVIDTNEFSVIDRNGRSQKHIRDFKQKAPLDRGDWEYWQIKGPNDAMNIAKAIEKDPNAVTLIMTNYQLQVHAVTTIPRASISSNKQATFKAVARATLRNTGSHVFAVSHDMDALLQVRGLVQDGIHISPNGRVSSLRETRPYGGNTPHHKASLRAPRLSPDTSEEFNYLRPVIKSAAPTSRNVPKGATGTLFEPPRRSKVDALGFFSQLERAVDGAPIKAAPAEQWKAWLASNAAKMGVKAEEIQWSGVTDWLALQTGKVTKDAVVQYLANNGVQVTEAVRGDGSNEASWQLADKMEELGYRVEDDGGDDVFYFDPQGNSIGYEELPPELQRAVDQWVDITPAMREKVAGGLPRFSKTGSKAPLERDELGRFRFAYGRRLEDTVKALLDPILTRLALKMASPELRKKLRAMKAEIARAQETAVEVAESMKAMPTDQAEMISDIIEQELVAGTVPPAELVTIATRIGAAMEAQTNELVRLGMISQEAADRWRGRYLPRFYESKLSKRVDPWMQAVMMAIRRPKSMQGIKGNNLKARGLPLETIDVADLPSWLADGWEIRDENYRAGTSDRVTVWRDYTREEREEMGEIRDARFRFVMGYMAAQKDIALGRLFEKIAADTADTGPHPGWVKVPSTKVEETGVNRFGKLSGMWVPKEVFDHLAKYDDTGANHELLLMYRKALGLWKESKTVLNPTAHANNVFGNVTMAHFAGVSYWDVHKYAGTVRDLVKDAPMVREARDAGLFLSTMGKDEIVQALPESLRLLADMQESSLEKGGRRVWNALALWLRKPMGAAYAGEDLFFRYMIYRDARSRGLEPGDAVNYAADFVFEYDDLPKGAMAIRDTFLPFFSWTYKAIPAMFTTATNYPWRFAAPAVAMYAVNAAMYAVAFGEKDDDWWQKIGRYVTDSDFRDKVRAEEKSERANLPPWLKGNSFTLGLPKAIRLGMDELTGLPVFMDISRMFPAGDLLDANSNTGGVPWLQSMTPSNPVLTTITAMFANRDMWTGRDLVDKNDTSKEAATKRAEWAWKQFTPAIAFGNYQLDRVLDTVARAAGTEIPGMFRDHTGVGRDKLPVQPLYTIENTFGIKARPYDLEQSRQIGESQKRELIRSLEYEIKRTQRYVNAGVMSFSQASKQIETDKAKIQNLKQGLTLEGAEKD